MDNAQSLRQQIQEKSSELNAQEKDGLSSPSLPSPPSPDPEKERKITRKQLINKLNYINFIDGTIAVGFKHIRYHQPLSVTALPLPCLDERLECRWSDPEGLVSKLKSYRFENISFSDHASLIEVEPQVIDIRAEGIVFRLPETASQLHIRSAKRHVCKDIKVQLYQNGVLFNGSLIDFYSGSFRVDLNATPPQTFQWINPEFPANLILSNDRHTIYSGECRILDQTGDRKNRIFTLGRVEDHIRRYHPKEFRSTRQTVDPSPDVLFRHPLTGNMVNLKVIDLSGTGFSVEDEKENSVLLSGMIIPDLELAFANSCRFKCMVQVVYRELFYEANTEFPKCGMAILDMNIEDHVRLLALLHQAKNKHSYLCNKVDLDALWNFFFETGFIYPKKYAFIRGNKEKIKETYEVLYTRAPNIARHFIYQDKGRILGHMAALRFYENTWLIHHHAADSSASNRAGVSVLNQIGRFINDSHSLYSIHMSYVICYYRPENRFPSRVFGGVCQGIKNPQGCSIDPFAYFHLEKNGTPGSGFAGGWRLSETNSEDLFDLKFSYNADSGGLMLSALDLEPGFCASGELESEYRKIGFRKESYRFSLKRDGNLKAVFIFDVSDIGLNMSDLTNCIRILVVDAEGITRELLYSAISMISGQFDQNEIPVLLYPAKYAETLLIPYEKIYNLWVLSMEFTDSYFRYLKRLLRFIKH